MDILITILVVPVSLKTSHIVRFEMYRCVSHKRKRYVTNLFSSCISFFLHVNTLTGGGLVRREGRMDREVTYGVS
jgi:hypothetical protein